MLHAEGYADIEPSHPLGGPDGSSDAMLTKNGRTWIMAVYFPQGAMPFRDVKKKVLDDYPGVAANRADGMAFVTNQHLTRGERKALAETVGGRSRSSISSESCTFSTARGWRRCGRSIWISAAIQGDSTPRPASRSCGAGPGRGASRGRWPQG